MTCMRVRSQLQVWCSARVLAYIGMALILMSCSQDSSKDRRANSPAINLTTETSRETLQAVAIPLLLGSLRSDGQNFGSYIRARIDAECGASSKRKYNRAVQIVLGSPASLLSVSYRQAANRLRPLEEAPWPDGSENSKAAPIRGNSFPGIGFPPASLIERD